MPLDPAPVERQLGLDDRVLGVDLGPEHAGDRGEDCLRLLRQQPRAGVVHPLGPRVQPDPPVRVKQHLDQVVVAEGADDGLPQLADQPLSPALPLLVVWPLPHGRGHYTSVERKSTLVESGQHILPLPRPGTCSLRGFGRQEVAEVAAQFSSTRIGVLAGAGIFAYEAPTASELTPARLAAGKISSRPIGSYGSETLHLDMSLVSNPSRNR
jgi:hypothetical protein